MAAPLERACGAVGAFFLRPAGERACADAGERGTHPFVAPVGGAVVERASAGRPVRRGGVSVAVLAADADAWGFAAATALAASGAGVALVCGWGAGAPAGPGAPVVPAARRLAARLRARGLEPRAVGRLV
ncbi:MAG TPA: hypothetical protein VFR97_07015, partial [Capillimicrobium sp.]|nr:hypothetical protein [Capillimicrobium sp.]